MPHGDQQSTRGIRFRPLTDQEREEGERAAQQLREERDRLARAIEKASPFSEVVGVRLEAVRSRSRRTTEDIASAARGLGLTWHRTTVRQTERGKRSLTAAELLLLPLMYGAPLRDLLPDEREMVWLTDEVAVSGGELARVLDEGYEPGAAEVNTADGWYIKGADARLKELSRRMTAHAVEWPSGVRAGSTMAEPDEAETKAAKRLDSTPHYVASAARELWGRGLVEERDARLAQRSPVPDSPRALQAARGHVTRTLIAELEPTVREYEKRRGEPEHGE